MNQAGKWVCKNVIVDQLVESERHIVLQDGRHLVFGRKEENKFPPCDCLEVAEAVTKITRPQPPK